MTRRRPLTRGQATVELALMVPVLALLTLGALDLGRLFSAQAALANAAREAARYCALHPGDSVGTRSRVTAELGTREAMLSNLDRVTCPAGAAGVAISVELTGSADLLTPVLRNLVGASAVTLTATASSPRWIDG